MSVLEEQSIQESILNDENIEKLRDVFFRCLQNYMVFLYEIAYTYLNCLSNKDVVKRKFVEVRQNLFEHVKQHEDLTTIDQFLVKTGDKVMAKYIFVSYDSADKFIDFENFLKFSQEIKSTSNEISTSAVFGQSQCVAFFKHVFKKPLAEITDEDLLNYKNISFLDDEQWKGTKCSYAELGGKIKRRIEDFNNKVVSPDRIEEISFIYDDTTESIVENKECSVCKEKYENDQIVSRMPCNHFFHRRCIETWFKSANSLIYEDAETSSDDSSIPDSAIDGSLNSNESVMSAVDDEQDNYVSSREEEDETQRNDEEGVTDDPVDRSTGPSGVADSNNLESRYETNDSDYYDYYVSEYEVEDHALVETKFQCPNCRCNCC